MTSILASAVALAHQAAAASRGESIVYSRGERSATVTAIRGQSEFQSEAAGEVRLEYTDADWLCMEAELVFPAVEAEGKEPGLEALAIVPQKSDRIATEAGEVFEVLAPAGAKVFRTFAGLMRVHSKEVSQ